MSKKQNKTQKQVASQPKWALEGFRFQALILIFVGFVFYFNSLNNQYALDDGIIIVKNDYVKRGFSGIKKIMTTDAYDSYYRSMKAKQQLSGGRYRPLSIVTFAIEQQLFGSPYKENEMPGDTVTFIRHLGSVLLYLLSIVVLLYFLRTVLFPDQHWVAFFISLLFLIHPLHTEVVANAKSRDEILSFLFIISTFIFFFKHLDSQKTKHLALSLFLFFLAFLSKEYAITVFALIPILLYIKGWSLKESVLKMVPFLFVFVVYILMRIKFVGLGSTEDNTDVLNNPYLFATKPEKWATEIWTLMYYIKQLFYPVIMSSDYSYSTIPYTNFGDIKVWGSLIFHLFLLVLTIRLFIKRNILAFALAFYLLHLLLVSNLVFNIGATLGERLVYHSSLGWAIIVVVGINVVIEKLKEEKTKRIVVLVLVVPVVLWSGVKTIARNAEWENDNTLFTSDALKAPNSALVNGNAGKAYVDMSEMPENKGRERELWGKALYHLRRAIKIHPRYVNGYINIGVVYFKVKDYEKTELYWNKARDIFPRNPLLKRNFEVLATVYYNDAMIIGAKDPVRSIALLEKSTNMAPDNADYWYNLGGARFMTGKYQEAIAAWKNALLIKPGYEQAQQGMAAAQAKINESKQSQ